MTLGAHAEISQSPPDEECTSATIESMSAQITVYPLGGLGNQLFVYGVGRALSTLRNCKLAIDSSLLQDEQFQISHGLTARRYHLADFARPNSVFEVETTQRSGKLGRRRRLGTDSILRSNGLLRATNRYHETHPKRFNPDVLQFPQGTHLRGYFQSWKYLVPVEQGLRSEIRDLRQPSRWFIDQMTNFQEAKRKVGLHVRRGDYPDPVGYEYYRSALSIASSIHPKFDTYLFSDDVPIGLDLTQLAGATVTPIIQPKSASDLESLVLLSECDIVITANSTFSWWAGWLANQETTTVIAPRPWHNTYSVSDQDLLPPHWLTVGR